MRVIVDYSVVVVVAVAVAVGVVLIAVIVLVVVFDVISAVAVVVVVIATLLPRSSLLLSPSSSSCHFSAVRFLKDFESVCATRLSHEVCNAGKGTALDYQVLGP